MFIDPLSSLYGAEGYTSKKDKVNESNDLPFKSLFENAINNVVETENKVSEDAYLLSTGQSDDLHTLTIDSTKAQLSVNLLVQIRNKALDSYSEIMRMSI